MSGRRGFLKGLSGLAIGSLFQGSARAQVPPDKEVLRVLQSATGRTSTLLVVMAHRKSELEFNVQDLALGSQPIWNVELIDLDLGDLVVYQLHVSGLIVGSNYRLDILDSSREKSYQRFFKSLDLDHAEPRIALLTCTNHRNADPQRLMFQKLKESRPDLILFPGDLIYANSAWDTFLGRPATPQEAYEVYCKTLLDFDFYQEETLTPIFSSWDDHDTAFNNSESNHPNLEIMLKMFRTFFPVDQRIEEILPGPGISYCLEAFGSLIVFFDVRTFLNKAEKITLGADQFNWAIENIERINRPTILISAIQFWNYGKFAENFEGIARQEFTALLSSLKSKRLPTLFLSGDVHYSQVQVVPYEVLGYETFEVSSSAMFSLSSRFLGRRSEEQGQLHHYGHPNFLLLDQLRVGSEILAMNIRCISERSDKEFEYDLRIDASLGSGASGRWIKPFVLDGSSN